MHTFHHVHDMLTALQPVLATIQAGVGIANLVLHTRPKRRARKNAR